MVIFKSFSMPVTFPLCGDDVLETFKARGKDWQSCFASVGNDIAG